MQSNNDCSKKKNKQDGVHLKVTLKLLSKTNDTILFDKTSLTWLFGDHFQIKVILYKAVARRVCVRIKNFGNALKREGEALMGWIVYHCQHQQQKQQQPTIEISRIVSLIEPKYRGLGPMLKPLCQNLDVLG